MNLSPWHAAGFDMKGISTSLPCNLKHNYIIVTYIVILFNVKYINMVYGLENKIIDVILL